MAVTLVDNAGGDTSANTEDGLLESVLGSIDLDLDLDEDPLQTVLDNTASTPNNRLINLGLLTAVAVAALSALLTVDLAGGITRGWTVAETAARIPLDDWAFYNDVLRTHPILTKAATSGTVYAIGDVIAQSTEGRDIAASLDRGRVTRSLLAGLLAHGPLSHFWYLISEDFFDRVVHMTEWWSVFPKILVDQTVWGPIWTSVYLLMIGLMQRDGLGSIGDNVRRSIVPLTLSGLKLWPAAHIITVSKKDAVMGLE
jgi:protein Mpv17